MNLMVNAEAPLRFRIEISHDGGYDRSILELDGGAWYLYRGGGSRWVASSDTTWAQAAKRACMWLTENVAGLDAKELGEILFDRYMAGLESMRFYAYEEDCWLPPLAAIPVRTLFITPPEAC
jgi:hypothetical protein